MAEKQSLQIHKFSYREITRSGSLGPFQPFYSDTDVSFINHTHIVRSISYS